MKMSPLQVMHYHFNAISVAVRPGIDIDKTEFGSDVYPLLDSEKLVTSVHLGAPSGEGDPHQFALLLNVEYIPEKDSHFPYTFSVTVEGVFTIKHDGNIDERKKLVVCNGAAILYGAAREQLLALTARQKFGPMMLPSANFGGMVPESDGRKRSSAKSRVSRKLAL